MGLGIVISVCTMATMKPKQTATRGKALCVGLYKKLEYMRQIMHFFPSFEKHA